MEGRKRSESRQRTMQIKVRVTPDELEAITRNAAGCSLTVPEFLRRLGRGHVPKSTFDLRTALDLCKAAGDLGRLGGLLKQWMGMKQSGGIPDGIPVSAIDEVFRQIRTGASELKEKVLAL